MRILPYNGWGRGRGDHLVALYMYVTPKYCLTKITATCIGSGDILTNHMYTVFDLSGEGGVNPPLVPLNPEKFVFPEKIDKISEKYIVAPRLWFFHKSSTACTVFAVEEIQVFDQLRLIPHLYPWTLPMKWNIVQDSLAIPFVLTCVMYSCFSSLEKDSFAWSEK